jgi:hypothetical protein
MATITGAHMIIYSTNGDADRAFIRDVLGFPHVDVGDGWLIFALPASEIAVHPAENATHEIYLMVNDVAAFVGRMAEQGVRCTPPQDQGWGVLTQLSLPGGSALGIYEPRHSRPAWPEPAIRKTTKGRKPTPKRRKPTPKRRKATPKRRVAAARKVAQPARRKRGRTRR